MPADANSELLQYYREELSYLRRMGGAFAQRFPAVAARLELGPDVVPDPHVERLIESFAFLTARIRRNLDASLPEITTALLDLLYPNYIAPLPSITVARFEVDPKQGKLTEGYLLPKHTPVFAESTQGGPAPRTLRFRTGYPVTLWPVEVEHASFESPDAFDFLDYATDVASVLRIRLRCTAGSFRDLSLRDLRFYLNGDARIVSTLYELIFAHARGVAFLGDAGGRAVRRPPTVINAVGFGANEDILPVAPNSHPGYWLLQEYFSFPAKFNFVDITGIDPSIAGERMDVLILLDHGPAERTPVDADTFVLGATPIVNLFTKSAEPIRIDHLKPEYRIVPDQRRESSTEIHSILRVAAQPDGASETVPFQPFFSFQHDAAATEKRAFWYARRQASSRANVPGSETMLSLVDLDFNPTLPGTQSVYVHALCTNRHLAQQLPTGAQLQIEIAAPVARITALHKPTPQLDAPLGGASHWKLVSHLTLNHLSLEGEQGVRTLREMLRLYAGDDPLALRQITGVRALETKRIMRRVGHDAWRGFCRGLSVSLTLNEQEFLASSPYLFASVLNRFFAMYAGVNSFVQFRVLSEQREGVWKEWPPSAGEQIVA
jgi:type VI secretion system protein ImpG